jgi:ABC-type glycerol-3-phosphate transport system permease component
MAVRWSLSCAIWLLTTFGSGPSLDALAGDLSEEYQRRRSDAWLWRQVLIGVLVSFWCELRAHPWLALRAVGVGFIVFNLALLAGHPVLSRFYSFWGGTQLAWRLQLALLVYSLVGLALTWSAALLAGWTVARLHRQHQAMAIVSVVATTLPFFVLDAELHRLIGNTLTHERYLPYLLVHLTHQVAVVLGLMLGGFAVPRRLMHRAPAGA